MLLVATTPSSTSKADWSALLKTRGQRALQRCDVASVRGHLSVSGGRAAAVARGAIAGASALLSSFEASSAVTWLSRDWMAAALLPEAAVVSHLSVGSQSEGQLSKTLGTPWPHDET